MAIKGKTKKKAGGGRGRATPPKPVVVERKPPLFSRRWFKRTFWSVVILAALIGGLRVWQNTSRSSALERYDRNLLRAEGFLKQHLGSSQATGLTKNVQDFSSGTLDAKHFQDLASLWEKDFKASKDSVGALKPPHAAVASQQHILDGIEAYVGVARLYQVAGIQKGLADDAKALAKSVKDPALKKKIEAQAKKDADQVQVVLLHASEWRTRADHLLNQGIAALEELNASWHVKAPSLSLTTGTGGTGLSQ